MTFTFVLYGKTIKLSAVPATGGKFTKVLVLPNRKEYRMLHDLDTTYKALQNTSEEEFNEILRSAIWNLERLDL